MFQCYGNEVLKIISTPWTPNVKVLQNDEYFIISSSKCDLPRKKKEIGIVNSNSTCIHI